MAKITSDARRLLPRNLWNVAARKLDQIDASVSLDDLRIPPGNQLEALKADRNGQYSIRIMTGIASVSFGMNRTRAKLRLLITTSEAKNENTD